MRVILLATRNSHKAAEVKRILGSSRAATQLHIMTLAEAEVPPHPDEDGIEQFATFEENAVAKVRYFRHRSPLPILAEDSGLMVDALDGAPGVHTKRFAPHSFTARRDTPHLANLSANNAYLLHRLRAVPPERRQARYVCVVAISIRGDDRPYCFRGEAPGIILTAPRGTGGFGYDPLFLDEASHRSYAELTPAEKDERSHRGVAIRSALGVVDKLVRML